VKKFLKYILGVIGSIYFVGFIITFPVYKSEYEQTHDGIIEDFFCAMPAATVRALAWPYSVFLAPKISSYDVKEKTVTNDEFLKIIIDSSDFDANMKDDRGISLLMHASRKGLVDVVKMLLDKGADVNYRDPFGSTALMYAATLFPADKNEIFNLDRTTEILIERGADVNAKGIDGMTALMYASKLGHEKIVKNILSCKNVDIDIRDKLDGMTALMLASSFGNANIVKMLVKNRANITLKNNEGKTALMLASSQHHTEIANIIHQQSTND